MAALPAFRIVVASSTAPPLRNLVWTAGGPRIRWTSGAPTAT